MIKKVINRLNNAMCDGKIDYEVVQQIMNEMSVLTGIEYSIINNRVVYKDKYSNQYHDAWVKS